MLMQIETHYAITFKDTLLQPLLKYHSCFLIPIGCRFGEFQAHSVVIALVAVESLLFRGDNVIGATHHVGQITNHYFVIAYASKRYNFHLSMSQVPSCGKTPDCGTPNQGSFHLVQTRGHSSVGLSKCKAKYQFRVSHCKKERRCSFTAITP